MSKLKNLKISIIIPVYKVEQYLSMCIDSIINQAYKNLEIILVDDGSPDNCPQICDDWAKKDKRIKVIHKENGGVSSARNMGLDVATGDYVTFVDSDDTINDNFSAVCEQLQNNYDIFIAPLNKLDGVVNIDYQIIDETYYALIRSEPISISSCWSKFYKKEVIGTNRFLVGVTVAEDKEFVIRVLTKCKEVRVINKPFYEYRDNPESVMNNKAFSLIKKLFDSTEKIVENVKTYNVDDNTKSQIYEVFSSNLYGSFRFYKNCTKEERKLVKRMIKSNLEFLGKTKEKSKKFLYYVMKIFGIGFGLNLLNMLRKLKIVK